MGSGWAQAWVCCKSSPVHQCASRAKAHWTRGRIPWVRALTNSNESFREVLLSCVSKFRNWKELKYHGVWHDFQWLKATWGLFGGYWWLCCLLTWLHPHPPYSPLFFFSPDEMFILISVWAELGGLCQWCTSSEQPQAFFLDVGHTGWCAGYRGWGATVPLGLSPHPGYGRGSVLPLLPLKHTRVWTCGCDLWPTWSGLLHFHKFLLT